MISDEEAMIDVFSFKTHVSLCMGRLEKDVSTPPRRHPLVLCQVSVTGFKSECCSKHWVII